MVKFLSSLNSALKNVVIYQTYTTPQTMSPLNFLQETNSSAQSSRAEIFLNNYANQNNVLIDRAIQSKEFIE